MKPKKKLTLQVFETGKTSFYKKRITFNTLFLCLFLHKQFEELMRLSNKEIESKILSFEGWSYKSGQISKEFQFKDFRQALNFVNKVGAAAEEANHHPDIFIHSWNKVRISLSTHDEGGVTQMDIQLAKLIQSIQKKFL